jgi:hypothetical protein
MPSIETILCLPFHRETIAQNFSGIGLRRSYLTLTILSKHGTQANPNTYRVTRNEAEVEETMEDVVKLIDHINYLSLLVEVVFIIFTVVCISLAVFLAIAGTGTVISQISGLWQTSNVTAAVDLSSTRVLLWIQ